MDILTSMFNYYEMKSNSSQKASFQVFSRVSGTYDN